MPKQESDLHIVTANRLSDGEAVFLSANLTWSGNVHEASIARTPEGGEQLMDEAKKSVSSNTVVEPYLVAVTEEDGQIEPIAHREKMRTLGPSVRRDLGKQAEANAA